MLDVITLPDGTTRRLGNNVPPAGLVKAWRVYGDVADCPLIPRAEWVDRVKEVGVGPEWPFLPPTADQDGIGMCNASATCSAIEAQRAKQGLPYVKLSGGDLYNRICGGGDNGSLLEDGIAEAMSEGVAPVSECPYLEWRRPPAGASASRKRFRVLEAFLCPTFDHFFSSILSGFDGISGVMWAANYEPGRDGWLPPARGQAGGHAIHTYKPTYREVGRSVEFGVWKHNSWSDGWGITVDGIGGIFAASEEAFHGPVGGWWAVRSVVDEGGVVPQEQ